MFSQPFAIGKTKSNPYAKVYSHCLKHSASDYLLHTSAACRGLSPADLHARFGLHPQPVATMPGNEDSPVLSPTASESLDKKMEEAIQRFEAAMNVRTEEFQRAM